ncbi:MAG: O-antigen polymerase, partial [Terriglobales bacterium]
MLIITICGIVGGRIALNRWFNHLTAYSAIWGSILILVQSRLIAYSPVSGMGWLYIFSAWLCLFLGSFTALGIRGRVARQQSVNGQSLKRLRFIIWSFTLIGLIGIILQAVAVVHEFGNLAAAIVVQANDLYHARLDNPELGGASYVGAFCPAACTFAGMYAARVGKFGITPLMPLFVVVFSGILVMGRAGMVVAGIWFTSAFLLTPRPPIKVHRWQVAVAVVLSGAVLVGGFVLINATRGLGLDFPGLSPAMERASDTLPVLPSLFFYYTGPVVGFSDYLAHPDRNPHAFWGMYTFAPLLRFAARLGADTSVPPYEESYFTPRDINIMTYLKNIHSDFGGTGVLLFPYMLGAVMTWLRLRLDEKFDPVYVVLLAHAYVVIMFSFAYNPMSQGVWYISLILGVAACYWL